MEEDETVEESSDSQRPEVSTADEDCLRQSAEPSESEGPDSQLFKGGGPADPIGWTKEEISALQREDPDLSIILNRKENNLPKPAWKEVEPYSSVTKNLWSQYDRLEVRNTKFPIGSWVWYYYPRRYTQRCLLYTSPSPRDS